MMFVCMLEYVRRRTSAHPKLHRHPQNMLTVSHAPAPAKTTIGFLEKTTHM